MNSPDFKPFWTNWHCRSNANLFMLSLATLFLSLLTIGILRRTGFYQYLLLALPMPAVYFGVWGMKTWRRERTRRMLPAERGPLSRDELAKARSKLRTRPDRQLL